MRISFSKWENYSQCPRRYKYGEVDKLPRSPIGAAGQRGTAIHDQIESFIKGSKGVDCPVTYHRDVLDRFRNAGNGELLTEYKVAFTDNWERTVPEDRNARYVGVFDAVLHRPGSGEVEIGEWKTGKPKDTHGDQRRLYTLMAFLTWGPEVVTATTYYFDNTSSPQRLTAKSSAIPKLIKIWNERHDMIVNDNFFPPRPGFYCRWCDFSRAKGGPCPIA
jgi:hypothetical protein